MRNLNEAEYENKIGRKSYANIVGELRSEISSKDTEEVKVSEEEGEWVTVSHKKQKRFTKLLDNRSTIFMEKFHLELKQKTFGIISWERERFWISFYRRREISSTT